MKYHFLRLLKHLPKPASLVIRLTLISVSLLLVVAVTYGILHDSQKQPKPKSTNQSTIEPPKFGSFAAPAHFLVTMNSGQITLTWSASSDQTHKVVTYLVYRNGTLIATTSVDTYTDTTTVGGNTYTYFVTAKDNTGGLSSRSVAVAITVPMGTHPNGTSGVKGNPTGSSKGQSGSSSTAGGSSSSTSSGSGEATNFPGGVSLQQIDGGQNYFSKWSNGFPSSTSFIPIGVFPSQSVPSSLAAENINFFTPMRNEQAGTWCPVLSNPNGNDMNGVNATNGFYAGGSFYGSWGNRAAFNVFGDELDGSANNWFDCLPSNITSHNQAGSWGGLTAAAFEAAEAASRSDDPSRPTYIQTTVTFMDGGANYFYSTADKQAICADADIFSFDIYPLVLRGGHVWDMFDQINEARGYCQDNRPILGFTEMDHMNGGNIYPLPQQTTAEVWNAIIAGARGVEYFDQYTTIDDQTYTGSGHYVAGAMYSAIKSTNSEILSLAPVINAPFANGYVSSSGSMSVMAKYYNSHFYIFAIPHASGSQHISFTLAGSPNTTVSVMNEGRSIPVTNGVFSDTFTDENTVHIYEVN